MDDSCPLCELVNSDVGIHAGVFVLVRCRTCKTPMLVYTRHKCVAEQGHINHMLRKAKEVFGDDTKFRFEMQSITDHYHFHVVL